MFRITNLATGETQFVVSMDGYDQAEWQGAESAEPSERESSLAGLTVTEVEEWALAKIEADAEAFSRTQFRTVRRQVAAAMLWNEVQRLKLANATGNFTTLTINEKARQFPTLAALAQQSGNSIATVATAIENRLWDRVRRMALAEAKVILGHDAVRSAANADEKASAADAIRWNE